MDIIFRDFAEFLTTNLKSLNWWGNAYGLAYLNKDHKPQLYPTPSNPNPQPQYVGIQDVLGTFVYIREMESGAGISTVQDGEYGACTLVENVSKRMRAVAVSNNCKNIASTLAYRLYLDLKRINIGAYTNYQLDSLEINILSTISNFDTLFKDETGMEPQGANVVMGAVDFSLDFVYAPSCNSDNINIC